YLAHHSFGNSYQYYPIVSEEDYGRNTIKGAVSRYFENSYLTAVSALVEEEKISLDDLKELIARIENQH
ncbi:MAG: BlaI/MecI/CopY family transcriptional regulator, partial [Bacteroidales bacterium]|nr:BlaI/MecI/CopY family transcriptional regulator [Bacteroidales bacterium]